MFDDPDLHRAVESDTAEVRGREETDSIAIIDDIRSHIRLVCVHYFQTLIVSVRDYKVSNLNVRAPKLFDIPLPSL